MEDLDLELELDFNEFADLLLGVLDAELENFIGAGDHIEKIIINDPVTVLLTEKGRKVVVKCQSDDTYDAEMGVLMAICRLTLTSNSYHRLIEIMHSENAKELMMDAMLADIETLSGWGQENVDKLLKACEAEDKPRAIAKQIASVMCDSHELKLVKDTLKKYGKKNEASITHD